MKFFRFRDPGRQLGFGFNFYRLSDKQNFGFIFRVGAYSLWFRYSKDTKKWFIG